MIEAVGLLASSFNLASTMQEKEKVYFARHNDDWDTESIDGSVLRHLYERRHIAVCYDGIASWEPDDYSAHFAPSAIRYINAMDDGQPAIVVATYKGIDKVLMGRPLPGSKKFFHELVSMSADDDPSLKLLALKDGSVMELALEEFPLAFLLRPRSQTLVEWHACQDIVRAFYSDEELTPENVGAYAPYQQEILAEEWLRSRSILHRKVFGLGRSLEKFDIVGMDRDGRPVIAQVKHSTSRETIEEFFEQAKAYGEGHVYFFYQKCADIPDAFNCVRLSHLIGDFQSEPAFLRNLLTASVGGANAP